jgi:hypothetical protein
MEANKTKSRKYRFQVVDATPAPPLNLANAGRYYLKRWKRRNAAFQVIDLQTGANVMGLSNGGLYSERKQAMQAARELDIKVDGRKERKSTRAKLVYSNFDQVAGLWASQAQAEARCRNGLFAGKKIYSYGSHYLAGELVRVNGKLVALVNSRYYSRTTSGHTSSVVSAAREVATIVLRFKPERNSGFGDDAKLAVKSALASIAAELRTEFDQFFERFEFRWSDWNSESEFYSRDGAGISPDWTDSDLCERVREFNSQCKALGLSQYRVNITPAQVCRFESHALLQWERRQELKARKQESFALGA